MESIIATNQTLFLHQLHCVLYSVRDILWLTSWGSAIIKHFLSFILL